MRLPTAAPHSVRDEAPDLLGRLDQVRVGKVGVAGGRAVSPMAEQPAHQGQVLARHYVLAGGGMTEVM